MDTTCFIYGDSVTVTASPDTNTPSNAFDFSRSTYFSITSSYLPNTMTYTFDGPRPYINSVRVWPYTSETHAPSTFTFQGSNDGQSWTTVVNVAGVTYEDSTYQTFGGYFYASLYSNYRANIVSSSSSSVRIYEM